jgi:outer membrane protein TolC
MPLSFKHHRLIFTTAFCAVAGITARPIPAWSSDVLSLGDFLKQVEKQNRGYQGQVAQREGATDRGREKDLAFAPSVFFDAQAVSDSKLPSLPIFTYDREITENYSLGVSQTTPYGLQGKLYYAVDYTSYVNAIVPGGTAGGIPFSFYDARPVLELTQSLWQNGFGRTSRANQEVTEAQASYDQHQAEYQRETVLQDAENAYWRLAIIREKVEIQTRALNESQAIYDYIARQVQMNLRDESDLLQSRASLESKKLDLKTAQDDESTAARSFNAIRNVSLDVTPEELAPVDLDRLESVEVAPEHSTREDVRAAEANAQLTAANSKILAEKDKPTLDVYFDYALNGRDVTAEATEANSFASGRPTVTGGVKFSMPLNFAATSDAKRGALREEQAAGMIFEQKALDQENNWIDLRRKIVDARERLKLAQTIEAAQKKKYDYERGRLRQGRTTTYNVLTFEQDYLQAAITRVNSASDVLTLITQTQLYHPKGHDL